jgi:hypothetical protein
MPAETDDPETIIREELAAYLSGEQSLAEFSDWLIPETVDIHQWAPPTTRQLVYALKLRLYEQQAGAWTEDGLKEKLREEATIRER